MRSIILLFGIFAAYNCLEIVDLPLDVISKINLAVAECSLKHLMDPVKILAEVIANKHVRDEKFTKFIACALKHADYIDDNGTLNPEKVKNAFRLYKDNESIGKIVEECNKKSITSNPEETAAKSFNCYQDATPVRVGNM